MYEKADVGTKMWARNGRAAFVAAVHTKPSVLSWSYRAKRNPYLYYPWQVLPAIFTTGHTEAASRYTEDTESQRPLPLQHFCVFCDGRRPFCVFRDLRPSPHALLYPPPLFSSSPHLSSASPLLRFLRVRRKQSHPLQAVAQERDPPGRRTPQRHAPRAARVHCVPIPNRYAPFSLHYILICPCRICPYRSEVKSHIPPTHRPGGWEFTNEIPVRRKPSCRKTSFPLSIHSSLLSPLFSSFPELAVDSAYRSHTLRSRSSCSTVSESTRGGSGAAALESANLPLWSPT